MFTAVIMALLACCLIDPGQRVPGEPSWCAIRLREESTLPTPEAREESFELEDEYYDDPELIESDGEGLCSTQADEGGMVDLELVETMVGSSGEEFTLHSEPSQLNGSQLFLVEPMDLMYERSLPDGALSNFSRFSCQRHYPVRVIKNARDDHKLVLKETRTLKAEGGGYSSQSEGDGSGSGSGGEEVRESKGEVGGGLNNDENHETLYTEFSSVDYPDYRLCLRFLPIQGCWGQMILVHSGCIDGCAGSWLRCQFKKVSPTQFRSSGGANTSLRLTDHNNFCAN